MRNRDVIDAEFEVVRLPTHQRTARPAWNGVGLPPEFATSSRLSQAAYLIVYAVLMGAVYVGVHWLAHMVPALSF